MNRRWTKREIFHLMEYCTKYTQRDAAKKLKRTTGAIREKAHRLGIRWRSDTVSAGDIAREYGCSSTTVQRLCRTLNVEHAGGPNRGRRYLLTEVEAHRVRSVLARKLARNRQQRAAGRARALKHATETKHGLRRLSTPAPHPPTVP